MDYQNQPQNGNDERIDRLGVWGRYALITLALIAAIVFLSSLGGEEENSASSATTYVLFGDAFLKGSIVMDHYAQSLGRYSADAQKELEKAAGQYRTFTLGQYGRGSAFPAPDAIRRYAILRDYMGKGDALVELKRLASSEVLAGIPDARERDIKAELQMWRDIYGAGEVSADELGAYRARIEKLELGPTEPLALQRLYLEAGDKKNASLVLDQAARSYIPNLMVLLGVFFVLAICGLAGAVLLLVFVLSRDRMLRSAEGLSAGCEKVQHPVLWLSFLVYMAAFVFMSVLVALLISPLVQGVSQSTKVMYMLIAQFVASVLSGSLGLATLVYLTRLTGGDLCALGLTLRDFWKNVGWGIMGYAAWLPIALLTSVISSQLFKGGEGGGGHPILPMLASGDAFAKIVIFILASVLAPFFEEIFFRGVLYSALRARMKVVWAVAISAAAFAVVHPQLPAGFLPIFGIGAVLAVLFELRKSLVPSMVAHAINNTVVLFVTILAFAN